MFDSYDPIECSQSGSSVHDISQARVLEQVAISFSRGSFQPRDRAHIAFIIGRVFTTEPPGKPILLNTTIKFLFGTLSLYFFSIYFYISYSFFRHEGNFGILTCLFTFLVVV